MSIKLGDRGPHVRKWREVMNLRFIGYAKVRGPLPTDTDEFGARAVSWQQEYEKRTGQPVDGVVSDHDLSQLKIQAPAGPAGTKPVLFTVHGTGQPDPNGPGLPADTARAVLDKCDWQGIGNYPAATVPMWPSVMQGKDELHYQAGGGDNNRWANRDIWVAGYSQGAVVVGQWLKHDVMDPNGSQHHLLPRIKKVVFWGNPMREQGVASFDEWIWPVAGPDSHGIMEDRLEGLENAPFQARDYAHEDDMYASSHDTDADEYEVAIQKMIFTITDIAKGPNSLVAQLTELATNPLGEGLALFFTLIDAIKFFTGTAHGYNIGPAIDFLRS